MEWKWKPAMEECKVLVTFDPCGLSVFSLDKLDVVIHTTQCGTMDYSVLNPLLDKLFFCEGHF